MSIKIDDAKKKGFKSGDSIATIIPKKWKALIGMRDANGNEDLNLKFDLMKNKYDQYFIAVYGRHQKKRTK